MKINHAYVDLLCEVDMSRVSDVKRDPLKVRSLMRSIARNIATLADNKTLEKDTRNELSRNTISSYLEALSRLLILQEQPAFDPHIRSAASMRKTSKKHFCDPSLAVAILGLDREALLKDLEYTGFLFESLAIHELNVYAKANDAKVYYYNDSYGLEVDAIVQKRNGDYAASSINPTPNFISKAA